MDFVENVRGVVEDTILENLYDLYSEKDVDKFLKDIDTEIITPEIIEYIEQLLDMVTDRIDELSVMKDGYPEDEDE